MCQGGRRRGGVQQTKVRCKIFKSKEEYLDENFKEVKFNQNMEDSHTWRKNIFTKHIYKVTEQFFKKQHMIINIPSRNSNV